MHHVLTYIIEENGYWGRDQILNKELVRYLRATDSAAISNEENGYWM